MGCPLGWKSSRISTTDYARPRTPDAKTSGRSASNGSSSGLACSTWSCYVLSGKYCAHSWRFSRWRCGAELPQPGPLEYHKYPIRQDLCGLTTRTLPNWSGEPIGKRELPGRMVRPAEGGAAIRRQGVKRVKQTLEELRSAVPEAHGQGWRHRPGRRSTSVRAGSGSGRRRAGRTNARH